MLLCWLCVEHNLDRHGCRKVSASPHRLLQPQAHQDASPLKKRTHSERAAAGAAANRAGRADNTTSTPLLSEPSVTEPRAPDGLASSLQQEIIDSFAANLPGELGLSFQQVQALAPPAHQHTVLLDAALMQCSAALIQCSEVQRPPCAPICEP